MRNKSREKSPRSWSCDSSSPGLKEQGEEEKQVDTSGLGGGWKLLSNCGGSHNREDSSGGSEYGEGDSVGKLEHGGTVGEGVTQVIVKKEVEEEVPAHSEQHFLSMNIGVKQEPGFLEEQLENALREVERKSEEIIKLRGEVAESKTYIVMLQKEIDKINREKEAMGILENRAERHHLKISLFPNDNYSPL